ncbi:MAG: general secretion pathway protein GspK [Geminicoccaceae bacterium]
MFAQSRGMALIAVLWITSLLALVAAAVGSSGRTAISLAGNGVETAKARMLADAGIHHGIYDLMTSNATNSWSGADRRGFALDLGDGQARIRIRDEDGKIDLNAAPLALLRGLFMAIGSNEQNADRLAAGVIDFRDDDSEPMPFGAEREAYIAAGRLGGPANRPFRRIDELADVLGMTGETFNRVRDHVTIYSGVGSVDVFRASTTVIRALPGMTSEAEAAILSTADTTDPLLELPDELVEPFEGYILPSRDLIFEVRSLGESTGGGQFSRQAVVTLDGGQGVLPFTIYSWRRGHSPRLEQSQPSIPE